MNFHSMTSSCLFNRGTTYSQTVTDKVLFAIFPKMKVVSFDQARNQRGVTSTKNVFVPLEEMRWT